MKNNNNIFPETPSQTAGPFVHIGLTPNLIGIKKVFETDLGLKSFVDISDEDMINITGTIFDGSNCPVFDVMIETWQCDPAGIFSHDKGFCRFMPNLKSGKFSFNTVKPGFTKNFDGNIQSPHISFFIVARGINQPLITRMYFNEKETKNDYLLNKIKKQKIKKTLIAKKIDEKKYLFNIFLQGANETVFFDF